MASTRPTTCRQVGKVGARLSSSTIRARPVRGALQELEDVLHDGAARARPAGSCRSSNPTSPWCTTSSAIRSSRLSAQDQKSAMALGGALGGPVTALHLRLEHAAHRPAVGLKYLETYKEFPPLQAPGELQPQPGRGANSRQHRSPERLADGDGHNRTRVPNWAPAQHGQDANQRGFSHVLGRVVPTDRTGHACCVHSRCLMDRP